MSKRLDHRKPEIGCGQHMDPAMNKRFKRLRDFDVSLHIKNDHFIDPPRDVQRNWLLNRALGEFVDDLTRLDQIARDFVPGTETASMHDRSQAELADEEIMENWQKPLMMAMAEIVTHTHGDVLEVGFGTGMSSTYIQQLGVRSHTIVECNDFIVENFRRWRERFREADIRFVHGKWQDMTDTLATYDAVFFHTYPLNEEEYLENIVKSTTFAEHFMPTAAAHLRPGGIFTYQTNEIESLSRAHQRLLLDHFSEVTLRVLKPLSLPRDVKDAWWADSMVVVKAIK